MSERTDALKLAKKLLNEPNADPDDDLRMLSRQLLRKSEVVDRLNKTLSDMQDGAREMIEANRDAILSKHEEAARLIRECLAVVAASDKPDVWISQLQRIEAILNALNRFHPMHGESWEGWPP